MAFRKFQAGKIFTGAEFLDDDQVLITTEQGVIEVIIPESEAGDDIQKLNGIISPGFINCHCHMELSHMKGRIPEKTGLVDFVYKVVTERHHPDEEVLQAIADAEDEMLRNGIVAVGDICNNALTIPQKQKGRLHYFNFIEASGWLPSVSQARFERAKQLFDNFKLQTSSLKLSIVPHASYSVSNELWQLIQPFFDNKVASIHNQETAFEDEFFLHGSGDFTRMYELLKIDNTHHQPTKRSSLQSYFDRLIRAESILLVHNTFTRQADIDHIRNHTSEILHHTFFCLCINANQYIEDAVPPIELLRQNNCNMVLGTDSFASNWSLSIADEIKTIRKYFPSIPLEEVLNWSTLNGAKALEMDHILGSFEKGKKPGIICFDENLDQIKAMI